jgi:hypothetical protein
MDEFIVFDRPDAYVQPNARPEYAPGSLPLLFVETLAALNAQRGVEKPIRVAQGWEEVEGLLRDIVVSAEQPTLVFVNQPTTSAAELNARILDFVAAGLEQA